MEDAKRLLSMLPIGYAVTDCVVISDSVSAEYYDTIALLLDGATIYCVSDKKFPIPYGRVSHGYTMSDKVSTIYTAKYKKTQLFIIDNIFKTEKNLLAAKKLIKERMSGIALCRMPIRGAISYEQVKSIFSATENDDTAVYPDKQHIRYVIEGV